MLLQNSYLPWSNPLFYTEYHLNAPDLNVYGTTFIGLPLPLFGFTEDRGWSFTISTIDNDDLYELQLTDGGHLVDDKVHNFDTRSETVRVKLADGSIREDQFDVLESLHGPVVGMRDGKALAARIAGFRDPEFASMTEQFWDMAKANDFDTFKAAFARRQLPLTNLVYADSAGNTYFAWNGLQPRHGEGAVPFWQGIVDGTRSDLIWQDYIPFNELPQVLNPESGFLQSANDAPFTITLPQAIDVQDYPLYFSRESMKPRPQHRARLLLADESITFEELIEYRAATEMLGTAGRAPWFE